MFAARYPVSEGQLQVDIRQAPVQTNGAAAVVGGTIPFVNDALFDLWDARTADGATRNTIYLGLLEWDEPKYPCDGQCGGGLAFGTTLAELQSTASPPLAGVGGGWADVTDGPWMPSYAPYWIAANGLPPEALKYVGNHLDVAIGMFLHEASHTLTLGHAPCGNSDPDPSYPVSNGRLDGWAYDSAADVVRPPSMHFDFMSYCGPPEFVSRFTYKKLDAAIRAIQP